MNFLFVVVVLVVVLGVLILVHEVGHFWAAKWAGIYVHRFSIGMGPPIPWLTWQKGETEYAISWLPLGGYVKMASHEEEVTSSALEGGAAAVAVPADRTFEAKPIWKRMIVILAGVTMNVVFAWFVYSFLAWKNGELLDPTTTIGRVITDSLPPGAERLAELKPGDRIVAVQGDSIETWNQLDAALATTPRDTITLRMADGRVLALAVHHTALLERNQLLNALLPYRPAIIDSLVPGRPAIRAGLASGDTIVSINGEPIAQWYDLVDRIRNSGGLELAIGVGRRGGRTEVRVTPALEDEPVPGGGTRQVGKLGIGPYIPVVSRPLGPLEAVSAGGRATLTASTQIVRTVQGLVSARISSRALGGPILIGQMAAQSARIGLDSFLAFMGLVSVNLAVLNLLPIPVLDGGQFVFLVAEAVRRKPLSLALRERLTLVGLVLILLLMVLAFSNDFRRILNF